MRKTLTVLALSLSLAFVAGCGKKNDHMGKMKGFRDAMCKCPADKDPKACAEKIDADEEKWEESVENSVSEAEGDKLDEVKQEMRICQRASTGGEE